MNKINLIIDGEPMVFWFGLGFLGDLIEEMNVTIEQLMEKVERNPFKYIPLMMFRSVEYGYNREGENIGFTRFDMADKIENDGGINTENIRAFLQGFTKSLTKGVPKTEADPGGTSKKKLIGQKTS